MALQARTQQRETKKLSQASDSKGILYQNLLDAGCNEKEIQQCLLCAEKGAHLAFCTILEKHRQELNSNVHKAQERIDCLDFLLHKVRKENNK